MVNKSSQIQHNHWAKTGKYDITYITYKQNMDSPHCKSFQQLLQACCVGQQFFEQWHSLLPARIKNQQVQNINSSNCLPYISLIVSSENLVIDLWLIIFFLFFLQVPVYSAMYWICNNKLKFDHLIVNSIKCKIILYLIAIINKDEEQVKSWHDRSWHVEIVLQKERKEETSVSIFSIVHFLLLIVLI